MSTMCEEEIKLTNENWDVTTQKTYHMTFLNERNAVRAVLYELLQVDNEIKCTNVEIQSLKTNFESQLAFMEDEVKRLQEDEYLEIEVRNQLIANEVKKIEQTNMVFSNEIEKYQLIKETKCQSVNEKVEKLFKLKSELKYTHQNQVENLRRFRMFCHPDIRMIAEVRLKSIDRKFCDELFYINSCEKNLAHIFSLIDDKSSQSGVCASGSSSSAALSNVCSDFFMDFAWMRNEQLTKRNELFEYFKKHIARDLVAALAAVHVHKPDEPIKFIANYLKHLKQNDFRVKKQEKIFTAAKYGEDLFPLEKI